MTTHRRFDALPTEQRNVRSWDLDRLSSREIVWLMAHEDAHVPHAVTGETAAIGEAVDLIVGRLREGGRLTFVGAGTSGRLGVIEAAECPPTFDTPPGLVRAVIAGGSKAVFGSVEGAEDNSKAGARAMGAMRRQDVVVGIAASGVTPFVHGALAQARRRRAATILVTCSRDSVPPGCADVVIGVSPGPEVLTGSTRLKAGTATKLVLNMLTVASMVRLGKVYENLMVDLQPKSAKLRARARRIIRTLTGVDDAAAEKALSAAGGKTKVAVVMLRRGCTRREAESRLAKSEGFLRAALER